MPATEHRLISIYIEKHRPAPSPGCEEYVFLTAQGKQATHISDDLRALTKDFPTSIGTLKVTSTDMRKFTATEVAVNESDEVVRKVAAHMTHGEHTAKKYYRLQQGISESVDTYSEITSKGKKRRREEEGEGAPIAPKLKKRIMWLPEEEDAIKEHFDFQLKTPTIDECTVFLNLQQQKTGHLFDGRSPKELQDKCRTIKRKLNK